MPDTQSLSWNSLFLTGSVVDIDAGRWRARTKIRAEDLGIIDSEDVAKALSLGSHRLAPQEAFEEIQAITSQAKRALDFHSLTFAMIKGARYVPSEQMEPLMVKLRECKRRHKVAVEQFMDSYAAVKAAMLPVIQQALRDAAKDQGAVEQAFGRLRAEYPGEDEVRSKFFFKWSVYAVQSAKAAKAGEVAEEEAENIKGVVKGMIEQLRTDVAEKVAAVMAIIQKGGKLKEGSITSAITCLDRVDALNVLGDSDLSRQTRAIRDALMSIDPKEDVSTGTLEQLDGLRGELEKGAEEAVRQAEQSLMGMGVRRLAAV